MIVKYIQYYKMKEILPAGVYIFLYLSVFLESAAVQNMQINF